MANKYGGLKAVAAANGVPQATFYKRIKNGHTPEEAAQKIIKKKTGGKFTRGSRELLDLAEENGIPKNTYYGRLRNGWNGYKAATEPVRNNS